MPGEGTNGMLPYENTTYCKSTIKSWKGGKKVMDLKCDYEHWSWSPAKYKGDIGTTLGFLLFVAINVQP